MDMSSYCSQPIEKFDDFFDLGVDNFCFHEKLDVIGLINPFEV